MPSDERNYAWKKLDVTNMLLLNLDGARERRQNTTLNRAEFIGRRKLFHSSGFNISARTPGTGSSSFSGMAPWHSKTMMMYSNWGGDVRCFDRVVTIGQKAQRDGHVRRDFNLGAPSLTSWLSSARVSDCFLHWSDGEWQWGRGHQPHQEAQRSCSLWTRVVRDTAMGLCSNSGEGDWTPEWQSQGLTLNCQGKGAHKIARWASQQQG